MSDLYYFTKQELGLWRKEYGHLEHGYKTYRAKCERAENRIKALLNATHTLKEDLDDARQEAAQALQALAEAEKRVKFLEGLLNLQEVKVSA